MSRIFDLPHLPEEVFNTYAPKAAQAMQLGLQAPTWRDGGDNDGELSPRELTTFQADWTEVQGGQRTFSKRFQTLYRKSVELYRRDLIAQELALTSIVPMKTQIDTWLRALPKNLRVTVAQQIHYKAGLRELLSAGDIMHRGYGEQVGFSDPVKHAYSISPDKTRNDTELVRRYGHPWCISNQSPFCVAVPTLPDRGSTIINGGLTCEDLGDTLSPFTAVLKVNDKITEVPYARHFRDVQERTAFHLRRAATSFAKIPREEVLALYLNETADALESRDRFPYHRADQAWMALESSQSLIYVRIGADEVGGDGVGDPCVSKARYHFGLGLKNLDAADVSNRFRSALQGWEDEITAMIGNRKIYPGSTVAVKMPQFIDIIMQTGDAVGGPNGTVVGQTLPNWCGLDGKAEPCARRTMIFQNKSEKAYSPALTTQFIAPLFHPSHHADLRRPLGPESVVLHELTHNLGPQPGKPKPGTNGTYGTPLKKWQGSIEELKGQNGGLYYPSKILAAAEKDYRAGKMTHVSMITTRANYRTGVLKNLTWAMIMVLRATRHGKFQGNMYSRVGAVQLGFLAEKGAITFDEGTKQWTVDFRRMPAATRALHQHVLRLYAKGDHAKTEAFFHHYMYGDGFKLLHADRILDVAGARPSVLFDSEVTGL